MNYKPQNPGLVTVEEIDNMLQRCGLFSLNYMALRLPGFDKKTLELNPELVEQKRRTGRTTLAMMECLVLAEEGHTVGFLVNCAPNYRRTIEVYCVRLGKFFTEEGRIIVCNERKKGLSVFVYDNNYEDVTS